MQALHSSPLSASAEVQAATCFRCRVVPCASLRDATTSSDAVIGNRRRVLRREGFHWSGCTWLLVPPATAAVLSRSRHRVRRFADESAILGNIFEAAMRGGGSVGIGGAGGMPFGGENQQMSAEQRETRARIMKSIREFRMKPRDVKAYLDRFVVEQAEAKKVLSVALCDHYNWARRCIADTAVQSQNYAKPNILILGPTGSGKTYLIRTLAKMLGVPFVKADATKFSETGIVGEDAEDVVRGLVDAAGGDTETAQYGMVYIDEVDKIAGSGRSGVGGYSGKQVQSNFLKIMEETEVSVKNPLQASLSSVLGPAAGGEGTTISTKFVLFIFSGAFNSLNELIKNRVGTKSIGFAVVDETDGYGAMASSAGTSPAVKQQSYLHLAETSDFVEAGLEPEFIGRVPVRVAIEALDANDLYRILVEAEDSVLRQYENEFQGYGITLKSEKEGLQKVAELAVKEKTGARSLVTVLEKALRDFKFELPSTTCSELVLTEELILNPRATLDALLSSPEQAAADLQRWLEEVERRIKLRIDVADDVRDRILEECASSKQSAENVLDRHFRATGVLDGFKQIYEATQGSVELFAITMAMYDKPEEEIEKWKGSLQGMRKA